MCLLQYSQTLNDSQKLKARQIGAYFNVIYCNVSFLLCNIYNNTFLYNTRHSFLITVNKY